MIYERVRDVEKPARAHSTDSWIDFYVPYWLWFITVVCSDEVRMKRFAVNNEWKLEYEIKPWESVKIPLWIRVKLDYWKDLTFVNRSWIASKRSLVVWACLIDNPYRWELELNLINVWTEPRIIREWEKIIQGVIRDVLYTNPTEWVINDVTERGDWAFGSTWV